MKILTTLGLVMLAAVVTTAFAIYSHAAPTQTPAADEEYGQRHRNYWHDEHQEMHDHWEEMYDECMEMMDEMHEREHNEIEEHNHGCH